MPYFYYVAGQTPIVPEHIWSKIANPLTDPVSNPVGSGGYVMNKCTPQNIQWTANPHYWQAGLAQVKTVNMPAFLSNNTCNEYLAQGKAAWGSQFIPNIQTTYVAKKAGNHYWFPPVANVSLFPNLTKAPLNDAEVREAISYGINRASVSKIGEYGYEPPANQTGIVSPTFASWASSAAVTAWRQRLQPGQGQVDPRGRRLQDGQTATSPRTARSSTFTIITNGGYSDWVATVQVIGQELAKVGIKITVDGVAATNFYTDVYDGNFQLAYNVENGGPSPFYEMRQWLFSKNSAAIGTRGLVELGALHSPGRGRAAQPVHVRPRSTATQHSIMAKLEKVMATQVPVIPVLEEVDWFQYNSKAVHGLPVADQRVRPARAVQHPGLGRRALAPQANQVST